ncbi:MAG: SAM-dependent methyltransferase [Spirochaetes bacterium GWF1_51_8]|nr:MAG: SAM-dependent methyltransferase [Spirochaetes bacterium GWF1_51_8]
MKKWYKALFENYANQYENEDFTKGTKGEVDFIEAEIGYRHTVRILDVGCGTGRHSIELAKRGYRVLGIDLSENMLARARENAKLADVDVEFLQGDARRLNFRGEFDLAIMLCEGAFPLMETDEMNFKILKGIARALTKPGKLIMTTLNGLFPLFHSVKDFINSNSEIASSFDNTFDLMTFRDLSTYEFTDDSGKLKKFECNERYYIPSEMTWLLHSLRFKKVDIFACPLGEFSRHNKLTTEDYEMLVVAEK